MTTYMRRRQQHGAVHDSRADGVDNPFPNKPVSHRRPFNPRIQASFDLGDSEKITVAKQPRGSLSHQKYHSDDIRHTTTSQYPRKGSQKLPRTELQMDKAIYAKELVLQEKLWKVEEKIRQRIQRDSTDAAAGNGQKSEEERHDRRQAERGKVQTKNRQSEQQMREPVRGREVMTQERRQEDVKQVTKRHIQRSEDKMTNTHEEERARGKRRETEVAQMSNLQRKESKETHEVTVHEQEVNGELNKLRWKNVKKHTRKKGGDEKDQDIWGNTGVKLHDVAEKAKERKQNITSIGAPVSSPSQRGRQEQEELRLRDSTDDDIQLLLCKICNRKFASKRLEVHVQICEKLKQPRHVFNSYVNRTKGTAIEEFWKTHSRTKIPEVLKKKSLRENHKASV
uniref:golgin subfamily A member 6-like protein 22 n=1 Tax=Scatophagus argus TaxID=75038 RepID=UPI001ED841E4|nr:golgin subfamily A member 6-like protein 22 [Scatophagus argus]